MLWNRKESILPFDGLQKKTFTNPKLVYWIVLHSTKTQRWAVLMHQYGGRSDYMVKQGKIYSDLGFNLLFIDARSHGISPFTREATAAYYGWDMIEILKKENIKDVFLHGVSYGGIGIIIAMKTFPKDIFIRGIVVEAICKDVKNIYKHLIEYSPIPYIPYSWMPVYLRERRKFFDWDGYSLDLILSQLQCPVLLVHSELDSLYKYQIHFEANKKALSNNPNAQWWLAPGMYHSHMNEHPEWEGILRNFINKFL